MRELGLVASMVLLAAMSVNAGYSSAKRIDRVWTDNSGNVYFGVYGAIDPGLCDNNAGQYVFNGTTPAGKQYYSTLLAAKTQGLSIDIWWAGGLSGSTCNWGTVSGLGFSQNQ